MPEGIESRLLDYFDKTKRTVKTSQPGLSVFAKTNDWYGFIDKISGLLCTSIDSDKGPLEIEDFLFWQTNDFLCKENLVKIENILPCKQKGLSFLFEQLYNSKYLSIELSGRKKNDEYEYSVIISALRKEQFSGSLSQCNTTLEIFEKSLETFDFKIKLNKLALSPVKGEKTPLITSQRILKDQEHSFSAEFFHVITNNSPQKVFVSIYEYFPKPVVPLLSSLSHPLKTMTKLEFGWLLKFELEVDPGQVVISLKLDKKLLGFEEYPNDPQRGWDILSMPIIYYNTHRLDRTTVLSNGLLIMIPEPDFSMPFNVICITGSVIAFFFTSLQSLQTWKDAVHWSNEFYDTNIVYAKKMMNLLKNVFLGVSLTVLYVLDSKGIIKMFG